MGFTTEIEKAFDFIYKAPFDNGLTEYEFDHVFVGRYQGSIEPNPAEVSDYCYKPVADILQSMQCQPHLYTAWFLIALPRLAEFLAARESDKRA
jgi:isopentenyl-diphosphate delta-isomerase